MKRTLIAAVAVVALIAVGCSSGDSTDDGSGADTSEDDSSPALAEEDRFFRDFSLPLPLFSPESAWNQRADEAAVLPESDAQILSLYRVLLGDGSSLEGYEEGATAWPYMSIDVNDFTIPIASAGSAEQEVWICEDDGVVGWPNPKWELDTKGGPVTAPAPAGPVRPAGPEDAGADGWLVIFDPTTFTAYDYFAATPDHDESCRGFEGGQVGERIRQAGDVDFFDVRGTGTNPEGVSSARAAGTPLLAGLILPEDLESGGIRHALALATPGLRNTGDDPGEPMGSDFFYPASTTETDFYNTDPDSLAAGQRIRLKSTIVGEDGQRIAERELAPITRLFLAALRDYGAYPVDNADGFTFYAEDVHTAALHLSDEEVNALIGRPGGTALPRGLTRWQVVMDALGRDLDRIPFAVSPGDEEPDPESAEIEIANFEVVEPATLP